MYANTTGHCEAKACCESWCWVEQGLFISSTVLL